MIDKWKEKDRIENAMKGLSYAAFRGLKLAAARDVPGALALLALASHDLQNLHRNEGDLRALRDGLNAIGRCMPVLTGLNVRDAVAPLDVMLDTPGASAHWLDVHSVQSADLPGVADALAAGLAAASAVQDATPVALDADGCPRVVARERKAWTVAAVFRVTRTQVKLRHRFRGEELVSVVKRVRGYEAVRSAFDVDDDMMDAALRHLGHEPPAGA